MADIVKLAAAIGSAYSGYNSAYSTAKSIGDTVGAGLRYAFPGVGSRKGAGRTFSVSSAGYRNQKYRSFKGRGKGRKKGSSKLRFKGSKRTSKRKRAGTSERAKLSVISKGAVVDSFTERNVMSYLGSANDHQSVFLVASSSGTTTGAGLNLNFFWHLKASAANATPAVTLSKIILYSHWRELRIYPAMNMAQSLIVTRWRPRYDTDQTPVQDFALASSIGNNNYADLTLKGATMFDSHSWCTAYKAVKTYKRLLHPGKIWTIRVKRTFKKGKSIDYNGEWYYTTTGSYPADTLTNFNFIQKRNLSEVFTVVAVGATLGNVAAGSNTTPLPALYIEDINKVEYIPAVQNLKSAFQSGYSSALNTSSIVSFVPEQGQPSLVSKTYLI